MIEFVHSIKNDYGYLIQDIYCCDCLFDIVMNLISVRKDFENYTEFITKIQETFPAGFLFVYHDGSCVLICKETFDFFKDITGNLYFQKRNCMLTDIAINEQEIIYICELCLIKEVIITFEFLNHFTLKDEYRTNPSHLLV